MKPCVDCTAEEITTNRPIAIDKRTGKPVPGPRCMSHHRAKRTATKTRNHARYVENTYSIDAALYRAIIEAQGGKCAICQRANGSTKRLAVDHDHSCCDGPTSCGKCVRGALCSVCNVFVGRMRDDPEAFVRGAAYLRYPPAQAVINSLN